MSEEDWNMFMVVFAIISFAFLAGVVIERSGIFL